MKTRNTHIEHIIQASTLDQLKQKIIMSGAGAIVSRFAHQQALAESSWTSPDFHGNYQNCLLLANKRFLIMRFIYLG